MHSNRLPNVCTQGPRPPRELLQGPSAHFITQVQDLNVVLKPRYLLA